MRYSIEPRDRIYVKRMDFCPARNMGKCLSNKYVQKPIDAAKKSTTDNMKTASKKEIHKATEATGDLKIADKITIVSKPNNNNNDYNEDVELTTHRKRYIYPEERQQIIN